MFSKAILSLVFAGTILGQSAPKILQPLETVAAGEILHTTAANSKSTSNDNDMQYSFGAPVMTDGVNLYYVFYGEEWTVEERRLFYSFGNNIGRSEWYGINRRYYGIYDKPVGGTKNFINCDVKVKKGFRDTKYSTGKRFSKYGVNSIIKKYLDKGKFPVDPNGLYTVFVDDQVDLEGKCSNYCAFHNAFDYYDADNQRYTIKYQVIPKLKSCQGRCIPRMNMATSPNRMPMVDAMINSFAHELVEASSDPELNAWVDRDGNENADKCSWNFGDTKRMKVTETEEAYYNTVVGGKKYLLQTNWDLDTKSCALKSTKAPKCGPKPKAMSAEVMHEEIL